MYCKYCGERLPENSKFCFSCGKNQENGLTRRESENKNPDAFVEENNPDCATQIDKNFECHPFKASGTENASEENADFSKESSAPIQSSAQHAVINPDGSINKDAYYARQTTGYAINENKKRNGENGYYYSPMPAENHVEKSTGNNSLAIAGFICSFLFSIVGLIISSLALHKAKETGDGKGLAIAGMVISIVRIVLSVLVIAGVTNLIGMIIVN